MNESIQSAPKADAAELRREIESVHPGRTRVVCGVCVTKWVRVTDGVHCTTYELGGVDEPLTIDAAVAELQRFVSRQS